MGIIRQLGKSPILSKYCRGLLYTKERKTAQNFQQQSFVETKSNILQSLLPGNLAAN